MMRAMKTSDKTDVVAAFMRGAIDAKDLETWMVIARSEELIESERIITN